LAIAHLDFDRISAGTTLHRLDFERITGLFVSSGQLGGCRHGQVGVGRLAQRLDADDVAATAAVLKVPVHGIGQVRAGHKATVLGYVLAPVCDQCRLAQQ
jgi:hypothetical protein